MEKQVKEEVGKLEKVKDGEAEKENHGSSEDETDDGNSSNKLRSRQRHLLHHDTDEEIYTAEIEEEDWIECMKRSTDPMLDQNTQRNENGDYR